jgi:uncharacterized protein YecE (DUF72 family)
MQQAPRIRIGTAGWSIPQAAAASFPETGSQLERYGARFRCVEINSSFYRPHRSATYAKWRARVPRGFRFSVKAPRTITHEARLRDVEAPLKVFLDQVRCLEDALGPILVQLPPSLAFDPEAVERFLDALRSLHSGDVVLEPRHLSWFNTTPDQLLKTYRIARVAADPACCPLAAIPGGSPELRYWRLHGAPTMYVSPYGERINSLISVLEPADWCVFDNTAAGAAILDALNLYAALRC